MAREQLDSLTGMRFLAAFAIVWLHADLYFDWASNGRGLPLLLGVSFFFVLSGFILTHAYQSRGVWLGQFIKGRLARLWPLHIACIVAVMLIIPADSQAFDGPGLFGKWASLAVNAALLQSWIPTTSYMFSWNSVSWSISTEMFFYAMFPVLLPLVRRSALVVLLIGALPIAALAMLIPLLDIPMTGDVFDITGDALIYSFPPARLLEFCVGMAAYKLWSSIRPHMPRTMLACSALELGAVASFVLWFSYSHVASAPLAGSSVLSLWHGYAGACFMFAAVIIVMASSNGLAGRVLSSSPMVKLGEVSFALYMTHQIVMKAIKFNETDIADPGLVLSIVLVAAIVGHYGIEKPFQKLLMGRARRPSAVVASAA